MLYSYLVSPCEVNAASLCPTVGAHLIDSTNHNCNHAKCLTLSLLAKRQSFNLKPTASKALYLPREPRGISTVMATPEDIAAYVPYLHIQAIFGALILDLDRSRWTRFPSSFAAQHVISWRVTRSECLAVINQFAKHVSTSW